MKRMKKDLRSAQIQLEASKRRDNFTNIMELRETDQNNFINLSNVNGTITMYQHLYRDILIKILVTLYL